MTTEKLTFEIDAKDKATPAIEKLSKSLEAQEDAFSALLNTAKSYDKAVSEGKGMKELELKVQSALDTVVEFGGTIEDQAKALKAIGKAASSTGVSVANAAKAIDYMADELDDGTRAVENLDLALKVAKATNEKVEDAAKLTGRALRGEADVLDKFLTPSAKRAKEAIEKISDPMLRAKAATKALNQAVRGPGALEGAFVKLRDRVHSLNASMPLLGPVLKGVGVALAAVGAAAVTAYTAVSAFAVNASLAYIESSKYNDMLDKMSATLSGAKIDIGKALVGGEGNAFKILDLILNSLEGMRLQIKLNSVEIFKLGVMLVKSFAAGAKGALSAAISIAGLIDTLREYKAIVDSLSVEVTPPGENTFLDIVRTVATLHPTNVAIEDMSHAMQGATEASNETGSSIDSLQDKLESILPSAEILIDDLVAGFNDIAFSAPAAIEGTRDLATNLENLGLSAKQTNTFMSGLGDKATQEMASISRSALELLPAIETLEDYYAALAQIKDELPPKAPLAELEKQYQGDDYTGEKERKRKAKARAARARARQKRGRDRAQEIAALTTLPGTDSLDFLTFSQTSEEELWRQTQATTSLEHIKAQLDGLKEWKKEIKEAEGIAVDFSKAVSEALAGSLIAFTEGIVLATTRGAEGMREAGISAMSMIGELAQQTGQYAILQGGFLKLLGEGWLNITNPFANIGIGIALVAIGTAMSTYASSLASKGKAGKKAGAQADTRASEEIASLGRKLFAGEDRGERVTILQIGDRQIRGVLSDINAGNIRRGLGQSRERAFV